MKAIKAREILQVQLDPELTYRDPDLIAALKLAIAALTRHINRDYITYAGMHELLEGETPPEKGER